MLEAIIPENVNEELAASSAASSPDKAAEHLSNAFKALIADIRVRAGFAWPPAFTQIPANDAIGMNEVLREVVRSSQEILTITSLGLDYKKYMKFKVICGLNDFGSPSFYGTGRPKRTPENLQFCRQFVIECALELLNVAGYGAIWEHEGKPDIK